MQAKSVISTRIISLCGSQTSAVVLCMQNSVISIRIISLYGSQTSAVVLCVQNSVISTRIASLYGSQPSSVVLCIHNSDNMTRINSFYGSQTSPMFFFAFKTGTLAPELQVSMSPSPYLRLLHAKQRLLDQKFKSLWVPAIICDFVRSKQRL